VTVTQEPGTQEPALSRPPHRVSGLTQRTSRTLSPAHLCGCIGFVLLTAVYPVARSFFRVEVDYNEGWNIYNAQRVVAHQPLYGVPYGWETVNYPMLWFAFMAFLHRFTHEYLFTARTVSLLALAGCCILVGFIVKQLAGSGRAALLAAFLTLGIFCTNANEYVGMDDPQFFAHLFFLLGFYVFLRRRQSYAAIALSALLFVVAGNIKHNPIDFPLAVLIELFVVSRRRALWFAACGLALAAVSIPLNAHFGGPYFLTQMTAPRCYTLHKLWDGVVAGLGPMLIPTLVSAAAAVAFLRHPRCRVISILWITSLLVGSVFCGGSGVSINTFFSFFFASAILFGLVFAALDTAQKSSRWTSKRHFNLPVSSFVAPILFAWLIIPARVAHVGNPITTLRQTVADQHRFDREVALLRSQPDPDVCESLLRCYFAGKPYIYDPFNATRLIEFHKLDPTPLYAGVLQRRFSAVQLDADADSRTVSERFPTPFLAAIHQNYRPVFVDKDVIIYAPKSPKFPIPAPNARQPTSSPAAE
jgi:hypothetical protein